MVALTPSAASPEMVAKPAVEGTLEEAPGDMQVEGLGQRQNQCQDLAQLSPGGAG